MRKKQENQISLKFIFFLLFVVLVIIFYISQPNNNKKINKTKTFEEMLEYSSASSYGYIKKENKEELENKKQNTNAQNNSKETKKIYINQEDSYIESSVPLSNKDYDKLLDMLSQYPAKSIDSARNIVNKLLVYKGYPENCIRVISSDIDQSRSKTEGNYQVANFNFNSGNMYISSKMLYELDTKVLIAILAHELDHFDKLAKVCKYLGVDQFEQLFEENNIKNIDKSFWHRVSAMATNEKDFNGKYYADALKRFITQNDLELTSSYSDFYRISENIRNPLEISAYEESDYVYKHFGIKIQDGPMKILTKTFNEVDWAIYNVISKDPIIKDERIAIFDYFFIEAILTKFPELYREYNICQNQKDGDMTYFWLVFENSVKSFYQKGQMDNDTYRKILSLLELTKAKVGQGITNKEIATALKYKINTLKSNLVYPNAIDNLEKTTISYLKYIKYKNIVDPEQELKCILTLINIENKITTISGNRNVSLYYINIPESLRKIYGITDKKQLFVYIYNNQSFRSKIKQNQTESDLLKELLEKNILDIRING